MSVIARQRLLIALSAAVVVAMLFAPRIPQDPAYHRFADGNTYLAIPNALNVLSNLLFAWVGIDALNRLLRQRSLRILDPILPMYVCFFAALILIALGSGYYHWAPDNFTLAWDRLPMTLAFMSFLTVMLAERVSLRVAQRLFPVLLAAGVLSIVYWLFSERTGQGDLRAYVLIQFLPVLLTPLILLAFPARYSRAADLWWLLAWIVISKLCEHFDHELYDLLGVVSGHSLKHIAAAIGCLVFLRHLDLRKPVAG